MRPSARLVAGALALGAVAGCGAAASTPASFRPSLPPGQPSADARAVAAGQAFLAGYVDADGRVVRRDQGGDTVSEGQGYGLLISVALGDRATFARIWQWTQRHLQNPDGLFAFHWQGAAVVSATPAADADSQIAWALALAGSRFDQPGYTAAARRVALAVAGAEIGYDDAGRPLLAAGPWGRGSADAPVQAEPGYWAFPAARALGALTGDRRWTASPGAEVAALSSLTGNGARLPADWIQIGAGRPATAVGAPGGGAPVQCGPDGQRALVWASLDPTARPLAARWWRLMQPTQAIAPLALRLSGQPLQRDSTPLAAVAAAATAAAAGDPVAEQRLLSQADALAARYPTYYGDAWDALGRLLLTTGRLVS